jgi:hypothetical protein
MEEGLQLRKKFGINLEQEVKYLVNDSKKLPRIPTSDILNVD